MNRISVALALALSLAVATSVTFAARQEGGPSGKDMPGHAIYDKTCSRCHGPEGRDGKAPWLVPFRWNYAQALDIVRHGGACGMPAFTESELSDEELKQIVDYLKTFN